MKIFRIILCSIIAILTLIPCLVPFAVLATNENLAVAGEGFYVGGAYVGAPATWANLNSDDADTTYLNMVGTVATPVKHTFDYVNSAATSISNVTIYYKLKYMSAGGTSVKLFMRSGAVDQYLDTQIVDSTDYNTYSYSMDTNPMTGIAWTLATLNACQFGLEVDGTYRWTYTIIIVSYTVSDYPTVISSTPTNVALTSATFNGEITDIGASNVTDRCFVWDTVSHPVNPGNVVPPGGYANHAHEVSVYGLGVFSYGSAVLVADTTYYYRAFATNAIGTTYGEEIMFKTVGTPTANNVTVTYIARTTSTLNCIITYDGAQPADVRFGWDTVASGNTGFAGGGAYTYISDWVENTFTTGMTAQLDIASLAAGTAYHCNVQIRTDFVTVTKTEQHFTTLGTALAVPTNFIGKPESNAINLSWTKTAEATGTLIRYSLATYPTTTTSGALVYQGMETSTILSGLDAGSTIYLSAWTYDNTGFSASTTLMVTTLAANPVPTPTSVTPGTISKWMVNPSSANLQKLPGHQLVTNIATTYGTPETTLWFMIGILSSVALAGFIWGVDSNHNNAAALVALAIGLFGGIAAGIYSGWMLAFIILLGVGCLVVAIRL